MNFFQLLQRLVALLAVMLVASCGGGGGSPGTQTGSSGTPQAYRIGIVVLNSSNASVNSIAAGANYVVRAVLQESGGKPVANRLVTFEIAGDLAKVSPNTALTNESGIAEVAIAAASSSSVGATSVKATAAVGTEQISVSMDFAVTAATGAQPLLSVAIFNAANVSVTDIANSSKFTARAVLLDASGKPAVGRIVSFSVAGGAAVVAPATALTDSTGRAEVAISPVSNASIGASTVLASAELNGASLSASLNFQVLASSLTDPTITLALINSTGTSVNSISVGGGNVVRALVRDGSGAPVANRLVSFSLTGPSIAVLNPTTALTNSSGVAEVPIAPLSVTSLGAATVVASATVGSLTITQQLDFAVSASGLSLSAVTAQSTSLASGGNTSVSVTALVGSSPATVPVNITFAASCGKINGVDTAASGVSVSTNGSGVASANYSAVAADGSLCSGVVSVTASSAGASPRSVSLTIAVPVANAITFVSATPAQIFVKGSGAAEQSVAKFKVLSSVGTPLSGVDIVFSIVTNPGGVGINASGSTANVSKTTDQLGEVSVALFSGTIPGPVKVRAALASNPSVFAESQNLTVASGPPSQRFMSLSVEKFNIEGWGVDGSSTKLTVRLADRQGNAVEDGTVVNFTAEGGQVAGSCATARVGGISSCSVDFISQNPRPAGGRVSVLAFTAGTKDYTDVNGNNQYDAGIDTLVQQGDAFRDDNEDNAFVDGEFIVPRGGTAPCAGAGGSFPSRVNTCDSNLSTTVRQMAVILFSSSSPTIQVQTFSATGLNFRLRSANNNLLPMPANTSVSATASGGSCEIDRVIGGVVPNISPSPGNPSEDLASSVSIPLKNCATGNSVFVTVTSPGGLVSSFGFTIP